MTMVWWCSGSGVCLGLKGVLIGRPGVGFSWVPRVLDGQRLVFRSDDEGLADLDEPVERGGELSDPGPAGVDSDADLALAAGNPGGGVQQPIAQLFDLDLVEHTVQKDGLGPARHVDHVDHGLSGFVGATRFGLQFDLYTLDRGESENGTNDSSDDPSVMRESTDVHQGRKDV